jgi:hypothetical protein
VFVEAQRSAENATLSTLILSFSTNGALADPRILLTSSRFSSANVFLLNRIGVDLPAVISVVDKTFSGAKIRLAPALVFQYEL